MVDPALDGRAARGGDLGQRAGRHLEPVAVRRYGSVRRSGVKERKPGETQGGVAPTMPESTCLHIQDRESGPIRVVELPWISVRIGRAAYCEVRLADPDLADEACRLTRRGRTWTLTPLDDRSLILLGGRSVDGPCPLPFDVPFRLGPYCLTLRHDVAAEPDWGMYSGPAASQLPAPALGADPADRAENLSDRPAMAATPPGIAAGER